MTSIFPTRQLGKNGPKVSAIGFGTMGLSSFYGQADTDEERFKVLDRALELGQTFWDSADTYGDSEDLIGRWFKRTGNRDKIFLATKFANQIDENFNITIRGDPEYVHQACEKSLKRLGVEYIDLYYVHRIDKTVPIEITMHALVELFNAGKIKYIGLSECSSETLRRANKVHPIHCVQFEYSPFSLEIEKESVGLLKTCRELGIAVVAYSPLGRGMLTGAYKSLDDFEENDFRRMLPRFSAENFPKNLVLVDKIKAVAEKKGCTAGQLALAWLLAQGDDIIPIPGTKKIKYLEENVAALNVKLTAEETQEIHKLGEEADGIAERYPQEFLSTCYGDTPALEGYHQN